MKYQYKIVYALLVSGLMSYEPLFLLHKHFNIFEILDKSVLVGLNFFICLINFYWVEKRHQNNHFKKPIIQLILYNLILFTIVSIVKISLWQYIDTHYHHHKPPIHILLAMDLVRQVLMIIAVMLIFTLIVKTKKEYEFQNKLTALENQSLQLQLQGLTAQLHPHFFFNSLNTLSELIRTDISKSEQFIHKLTQFLRYVLANQQNNFLNLKDELDFVKTYFFLMEIRFSNRFSVQYSTENVESYQIPSIVCLFILENIFKHNIVENLSIEILIDPNSKYLIIRNSIRPKLDSSIDKLGLGLENVRQKCLLLTQREVTTTVNQDFFSVNIPIIQIK